MHTFEHTQMGEWVHKDMHTRIHSFSVFPLISHTQGFTVQVYFEVYLVLAEYNGHFYEAALPSHFES